MNFKTIFSAAVAVLLLAFISRYMSGPEEHHDHDHHDHEHHEHSGHDHAGHEHKEEKKGHHGHHHVAPHGGTLVVLGNEFAHLEFLLNPLNGLLQVYSLDGMAVMATRLQLKSLDLEIMHQDKKVSLSLEAQANPLTGETVDNSSLYTVTSKDLVGLQKFKVNIPKITIKGVTFENVEFGFPEGNEHH